MSEGSHSRFVVTGAVALSMLCQSFAGSHPGSDDALPGTADTVNAAAIAVTAPQDGAAGATPAAAAQPQIVHVAHITTAHRGKHRKARSVKASYTHHHKGKRPATKSKLRKKRHNASSAGGSVWDKIAQCESTGDWGINTGNGFSGGLQFTPSTWKSFGGHGQAHHASREEQIAVAERVLAKQGWDAWPACTRKLGLR